MALVFAPASMTKVTRTMRSARSGEVLSATNLRTSLTAAPDLSAMYRLYSAEATLPPTGSFWKNSRRNWLFATRKAGWQAAAGLHPTAFVVESPDLLGRSAHPPVHHVEVGVTVGQRNMALQAGQSFKGHRSGGGAHNGGGGKGLRVERVAPVAQGVAGHPAHGPLELVGPKRDDAASAPSPLMRTR